MQTVSPSALFPRATLAHALAMSALIVEKRTTIPILANVALCGTALRATDLDMELLYTVSGAIADDGFSVTMPAHTLSSIARKAKGESATVTVGDGMAGVNFDGVAAINVQTLPFADFPILSFDGEINSTFEMACADLSAALSCVQFAISQEETRYYLNGVFLHSNWQPEEKADGYREAREAVPATEIRFCATDGHRLVLKSLPCPDGASGMPGVILPKATVKVLLEMLEPVYAGRGKNKIMVSPENVKVEVNCTKIRFTVGDMVLTSKLIDGTFPDYNRVIPRGNDKPAAVSRADLRKLVEQVSIISSERGRAVKLSWEAGRLTATVTNPDCGSASHSIQAEYESAPLDIGFNARYVLDILSNMPGGDEGGDGMVYFTLAEPGSPTLIRPTRDERDLTAVLMPMRV